MLFPWDFRYFDTMTAKKVPVDLTRAVRFEAELNTLYARRSAIDLVIESMKEYQRYRARRLHDRKLKTA